jgi:hypothetical protein
MSDDLEMTDLDERERRLFAQLPRESAPAHRELDHLVSALKAEGFLRERRRGRVSWALSLAAAVLIAVLGGVVGGRIAARHSLESQLERTDLTVADRILLMQRAGSAYVRASNAYASAVAQDRFIRGRSCAKRAARRGAGGRAHESRRWRLAGSHRSARGAGGAGGSRSTSTRHLVLIAMPNNRFSGLVASILVGAGRLAAQTPPSCAGRVPRSVSRRTSARAAG